MSNIKTFESLANDFISYKLDEFAKAGKRFYDTNATGLVDVSRSFRDGGLKPLLYWEIDNRRFEMMEGRMRLGPLDWYHHNTMFPFSLDSSAFLGVKVLPLNPDHLAVSEQDFLLHISDALESLYQKCPPVAVVMDNDKELKFNTHLSSEQMEQQKTLMTSRVITPIRKQFEEYRNLKNCFETLVIQDPNRAKNIDVDENITRQLVQSFLNQLERVPYSNKLLDGRGLLYKDKLENFIEIQNQFKQKQVEVTPQAPQEKLASQGMGLGR